MLREVSKYGDLLVVGVKSDEDCLALYGERPIMTTAERCAELEALPCVYKVVRGSPCTGISEEFIWEHNINVCVQPWEYDMDNKSFSSLAKQGSVIDNYKGRTCLLTTPHLINDLFSEQAIKMSVLYMHVLYCFSS